MNQQTPPTEEKSASNSKQYLYIALILILLGLGITMIYKSFAPAKKVVAENIEDAATDVLDENDHQPADQTLNDIIDKQDVDFDEDVDEDVRTKGSDDSKIESLDEPETTKTTPNSSPNTQTTVLADKTDTPRLTKYMVITGSFGSITNARKRLEQTIAAGYRDAEIVQFDHSKYHTVCALRTNYESTAQSAIRKLKNRKIDAILHTTKGN